jgi:hypothetical protein
MLQVFNVSANNAVAIFRVYVYWGFLGYISRAVGGEWYVKHLRCGTENGNCSVR